MPRSVPRTIGSEDSLARRIEYEREQRGWSPASLAERMTKAGCQMSQSAVWKIENGRPRRRITVDEAVAFAAVFETTLEKLLVPVEYAQSEAAMRAIDNLLYLMSKMQELSALADEAWTELARVLEKAHVQEVIRSWYRGEGQTQDPMLAESSRLKDFFTEVREHRSHSDEPVVDVLDALEEYGTWTMRMAAKAGVTPAPDQGTIGKERPGTIEVVPDEAPAEPSAEERGQQFDQVVSDTSGRYDHQARDAKPARGDRRSKRKSN